MNESESNIAARADGRLTHVGAWLDSSYKARLRLVQAKADRGVKAILEEALTDLFSKYSVAAVREERDG